MKITKGEYCQFSLKSRVDLLRDFGQLEFERSFGDMDIRVFMLYDFYVEVIYSRLRAQIEKVEPVTFVDIIAMYNDQQGA